MAARARSGTGRRVVLPDVLRPGLAVVFCGSAAGRASARAGAYYAGPGNRFFDVIRDVGLVPRRLAPREFRELPTWSLGLTDLAKRESGPDRELSAAADAPDALRRKIERFEPGILAFVGKRAARVFLGRTPGYGPQPETVGRTRIHVLPSTSGAARRYWDVAPWRRLAAEIGSDRRS